MIYKENGRWWCDNEAEAERHNSELEQRRRKSCAICGEPVGGFSGASNLCYSCWVKEDPRRYDEERA